MNNVVSLSGGKDSTAMLHMMLDRGESIHSVVFFDTGWEFPEMHDHIDEVERKTGIEVERLALVQGGDFIVANLESLPLLMKRHWPEITGDQITMVKKAVAECRNTVADMKIDMDQ